jgi:hypothetical protein
VSVSKATKPFILIRCLKTSTNTFKVVTEYQSYSRMMEVPKSNKTTSRFKNLSDGLNRIYHLRCKMSKNQARLIVMHINNKLARLHRSRIMTMTAWTLCPATPTNNSTIIYLSTTCHPTWPLEENLTGPAIQSMCCTSSAMPT